MDRSRRIDLAVVVTQVGLATGLAYALTTSASPLSAPRIAVAALLLLVGFGLALRAWTDLRPSFRVAPTPGTRAVFIDRGVYRRLRHPMYNAVTLCLAAALAFRPSRAVFAAAVANFVFYLVKSRYEERLLAQRYAEYDAYRRRTWGVLPGL